MLAGRPPEELHGHRVQEALHGVELVALPRILEHRPGRHSQGNRVESVKVLRTTDQPLEPVQHLLERMAKRAGREELMGAPGLGIEVPGDLLPPGALDPLRP